jgi:Tol biopolymer transport system component
MLTPLLALSLLAPAFGGAGQFTPAYEANCQLPRWSHDGSKLAYEVNYHERKVIEQYILSPGSDPLAVRPVAKGIGSGLTAGFDTGGSEMVVHELAWSPSSSKTYVYSASGADRDYDLYLYSGSRIASHPGADGGATWSPDGALIAFTSARSGQGDVYLLEVSDLSAPPKQITGDPTASELYLAWSPDSRSLAFVGHTRTGDNIYLVEDVRSPSPTPITSWSHTQTRPSFSPDGTQLAFYSNHTDPQRFDLYVMPLGGEPSLLVEGVVMNPDGPKWIPDTGDLVVVLDDDDRYDPVFRVTADDPGSLVEIKTGTVGNGDHDLAVGTDGRVYLAIAAQGESIGAKRDFKRIYVMPLD